MFEIIGFILWLGYWIVYIGMWLFGGFFVLGVLSLPFAKPETPEQIAARQRRTQNFTEWLSHGSINHEIHCPQCTKKGHVRVKSTNDRKGLSGGKAVGGLLTGGASLLVTGISRREKGTTAFCENCRSTWRF